MNIILYLLQIIHQLYQQNCWLINFICKYIPLKQWAFDDAHSPKYQKFKIDKLPIVEEPLPKLKWKKIIAEYPTSHNGKFLKPIRRKTDPHLSKNCKCPRCDALPPTFIAITAKQDSFSVKYVKPPSSRIAGIHFQSSISNVLTVLMPLSKIRNASTS